MENKHLKNADSLFDAILSLKNKEECCKLFEDLCTIKEIQDMVQRFEVAKMLDKNQVYSTITAKTGASTATVSRVNKCLVYGSGGYRMAIDRIKGTGKNDIK